MPGHRRAFAFQAPRRLIVADKAFSGKVGTGFPQENATKHEQLDRFPNRKAV
jgi:hypothetical protein